MANLEVTFLGTSAAMPSENRFLSSVVINRNGTLFIFDAGEGMQYNFIRGRVGFNKKTMLFITHMHSDHILGLLGFFQTLSFTNKKEYIDWIITAKRDETRKERLSASIDRLEKGWKNPRNL